MKKEKKKLCTLVLIRNNKRLTGTAAQLAHISDCGGWNAFLQGVADQVISNFAQAYNDSARRPHLKVVGDRTQNTGVQ